MQIIGVISLISLGCILCLVFVMFSQRQQDEQLVNDQRQSALSKLKGMKFADILVGGLAAPTSSVNECAICLSNFT